MPTITPQQMKALHAAAKARGLSHEDLRGLAGVTSLRLCSVQRAAELLDSLNRDQPPRAKPRPAPRTRRPAGVIAPASTKQRRFLAHLLRECGAPPPGFDAHGVDLANLAGGAYSTRAASSAITHLQTYLARRAQPRARRAHDPKGRRTA